MVVVVTLVNLVMVVVVLMSSVAVAVVMVVLVVLALDDHVFVMRGTSMNIDEVPMLHESADSLQLVRIDIRGRSCTCHHRG